MKNIVKASLLLAAIPLALSACSDLGDRLVILETSNTIEYVQGKCFQLSYKQCVETLYIFSVPNNPEADPSEYTYDFTWKDEQKNSYFDFIDGLSGKSLISILKVSNYCLKLNVKGSCDDVTATYGYIKVFRYAYDSLSEKVKDIPIYAYVAIGEQASQMVDKPALNEDGTVAK